MEDNVGYETRILCRNKNKPLEWSSTYRSITDKMLSDSGIPGKKYVLSNCAVIIECKYISTFSAGKFNQVIAADCTPPNSTQGMW